MTNITNRLIARFVAGALVCSACLAAADEPESQTVALSRQVTELKALLADQQRQIQELRAWQERQKTTGTDRPAAAPASSSRAIPAIARAPEEDQAPLQFKIGSATIMPVGFMDFTSVYRSTNPGSGIGTNFGSIPYNNGASGKIGEFRLSAQNSRIGLRVDARIGSASVLGYLESDFLGFVPTNAAVTSNSDTLRLRLYWVDVRKGKVELLAGQSWSMLTPNRKGLSALPSDLFYSQDVDVNYQTGLVWSRQPQFRFIVHPDRKLAMGVSLESPEQYIGGSGGSGLVALPAALTTSYAKQLDDGTTTLSAPNAHPDIIGKVAFDPNGKAHLEVAGVFRTFRVYNPANTSHFTANGFGGSVNANFELVKGLRVLSNNYWSDGGGRYIFGLAPDVVIRPDGSLSALHAASTVDGIEFQAKSALLYAYYGGAFIGKNAVIDATGKPVGYGYTGASNAQNKSIHEPTFGITQIFWRDPRYGALQLMLQYSYLLRYPWFQAAGAPKDAHAGMVFLNVRYVLPGSAPAIER